MRRILCLSIVALSLMGPTPAASSTGLEDRLEQFIARYAPEYEEVPSDDRPSWGFRNAEHLALRSATLRKKSSQPFGDIVVHHRINIYAYSYPDRAARDRALEGWFRCFGTLCDPLVLKNDTGFTKSPPLLAIANDTEIVVLESRCETLGPEWHRNMQDFEDRFASPSYLRIEVEGCSSKVRVTSKAR